MDSRLVRFADRQTASRAAADLALTSLQAGLDKRGRASLFVSGGSTPQQMFSILSTLPLEWARVTTGLVDERWVGPEDPASNENLVRSFLLKGPAAASGFLPLREPGVGVSQAAATRAVAYSPHCDPPSFILLGMGSDGHTASWFPGSVSLAALLAPGPDVIALSNATGCPVAGEYPVRLTLTRPAVARAEAAALLIFGDEKLRVLESALNATPEAYPIRAALDDLADRLSIFWAP